MSKPTITIEGDKLDIQGGVAVRKPPIIKPPTRPKEDKK